MSTFLRWLRRLAFAAVALVVLALAAVYALSELILRRRWEISPTRIAIPSGPAAIERGRQLAVTRGCPGCHGEKLEGGVFFDQPRIARLVAPNLTELVRTEPVESLERSIRHGVRKDGTTVRAMPSETFFALTDDDLGALLAYLRSQPPATSTLPATEIRILGRVGLVLGQYQLAPQLIQKYRPRRLPAPAAGDLEGEGRYLSHTMCVECHGLDLHGVTDPGGSTPHLAIVASYTHDEFVHLLRTGTPASGPPLNLMAEVARGRFVHLTDEEVDALYTYLRLLADPSAQDRI